jgi:hypothetical protein
MSNFPPSSYPEQNPPPQPGESVPAFQPTQPAFPPLPPGYGQPGYSQPGYVQAPAPGRRRLWLILVAVLLLLLLAGGAFAYLQVRPTPQKTLQAYCNALKANDAQALYDTLASAARAQTSVSQLRQELQLVEFLVGGVKECIVNTDSIQQNGSAATGTVTIVTNRGRSTTTNLHLIEEQGQWKVDTNAATP